MQIAQPVSIVKAWWIVSLQTVNFIETERKVPFQERKSEIFQALLCSVSSCSDNRGWRSGVRRQHFLQKNFKQCGKLLFSYRKLEHSGSVCVWPWEGLRQQYHAGQQGGRHQEDHGVVAGHTQDQAAFLPLGTQGKKSTLFIKQEYLSVISTVLEDLSSRLWHTVRIKVQRSGDHSQPQRNLRGSQMVCKVGDFRRLTQEEFAKVEENSG